MAGIENYLSITKLFSPLSWRTLYHSSPIPLSAVSSHYHHKGLNLKVRSPGIESQIPHFPTQKGQVTSLCLAPFSVNMDRNTCLPSRVFRKQQKCKYTVNRTGLIKQEGTASPRSALSPAPEHCSARSREFRGHHALKQ